MLKKIAFGILLAPVMTTSSYAESLIQVYQDALKNDAQIKISQNSYLATLENKPQILSGLKPRVDLSADASYNLSYTGRRSFVSDDGSAFLDLGYSLTATKPLINKKLNAQVNQVDAVLLQAKASFNSDKQDLIIRVAEAYFAYLNANDTLLFRVAEKNAIARQLNQAKAFFEAGRSAITDVKEAQARFDLADAQVEIAKQQIDVSRESIRAITTRYYQKLNGAANNIPLIVPKPNNIKAWTQSALANSLDIQQAKYAVDIAQKNVDIERAERSATVDIFARQSGSTNHGEDAVDRDTLGAAVGLQLNIPLYRGGNISSRIRQARHTLAQTRQQLELQKRTANQETSAAYLTVNSGLLQVKALKQALNSTQAAASATQAGFEAGTRTAVDVLLSLRETFSAQRDYTTARYEFLLNTLKLKQAAGTLSEADLTAVSKLLTKPLVSKKK